MADGLFGGVEPSGGGRPRGRPKGSTNKRSSDLRRYIEAIYAGQTPGQQSAQLALVTPAELRQAKAHAKELGLVAIGLSPMMLAMVVKATNLARAIGCETKEAWLLLAKERAELLPYIHQKLPQAPDPGAAGQADTVYLIPDGAPTPAQVGFELGDDVDEDDDQLLIIDGRASEVSRPKSHGDAEGEQGQ